ncbi:MAG: TrmH family RNA methyltransferase [Planctomycetota bacterium]|jgi:TrmH family RNA methyltransferase
MPRNLITSPQNERVKSWARLQRDGNFRRERGESVLEGRRLVASAFEAGRVKVLMHCPKFAGESAAVEALVDRARTSGIEVVELGHTAFRKLADVPSPQGVACIAEMPPPDPDAIFRPDALLLVACGVQEPGNLGSMMRSGAAAGATGFVAVGPSADIYHPRCVRGSAGAVLVLPTLRMPEDEFLAAAKRSGLRLLAASPRGGTDFRAADYSRPVAIVIGSEAHGVSDAVADVSETVTIAMPGAAESLNAAAAAAVIMFEAGRER